MGISYNPDVCVSNFDPRDHRLQVGFAELGIARFELIAHGAGEGVNDLGGQGHASSGLGGNPLQGCLGDIALVFENGNPIFQNVIEFNYAVFNGAVEPLQFFLMEDNLRFKG